MDIVNAIKTLERMNNPKAQGVADWLKSKVTNGVRLD